MPKVFLPCSLVTVLLTGVLAACGSETAKPAATPAPTGLTAQILPKPAAFQLDAADAKGLAASPSSTVADIAHAFAGFRYADATYEMQFGAFKITESGAQPWQQATELAGGAGSFTLKDATGKVIGTGHIEDVTKGEVLLSLESSDPKTNRSSFALTCSPNEHFLGFGGQAFDVDHRGQTVPIWVAEDGISKVDTNDYPDEWFMVGTRHSTHTSMPIYLSSKGYALMLESNAHSVFSMCSEADDAIRIENWDKSMRIRIFHGKTPAETLELLTARLGRPKLPPAFTFAPWLDAIYGSANVRRVADKLRANHVPVSAIWTEDWRGGAGSPSDYALKENWNVDPTVYPDFTQLAEDLHKAGYKFLTYNNPFLAKGADIFQEAMDKGSEVKKPDGSPYLFTSPAFVQTGLIDFSNPAGRAWAKSVYKAGLDLGADGYMSDYCEWLPTDAILASGQTGLDAHNQYPVEAAKMNRELFDELFAKDGVDRLYFMRSAYLGSQPLVSVMWGGDQQTDWSRGDGLPSILPIGLGLGVVGFPYYGSDIAGYTSLFDAKPSTKELWFRWSALGALTPVMRTHHGRSAGDNWNWEKDDETIAHLRRWAKLHIQLFPYLYGLAKEGADKGLPMMRPLALQYPQFEAGWTMRDEFMLGDRILVAPVLTEGATLRQVRLPAGNFYPLFGGAVAYGDGISTIDVPAPMTEVPAFVPAGTLLVLLPETVETLVPAETGVGTLAAAKDDRELWLWPAGTSAWTEVGGLNYAWNAKGWDGPTKAATWNGKAVALQDGAVTVTGPGKLIVDGKATLTVTGGVADRKLLIRLR